MSAHTPGAWNNADAVVSSEHGIQICDPYAAYGKDGRLLPIDERAANANLIAAAPDMLDTLRKLEIQLSHPWAIEPAMQKVMAEAVLATIAKATGGK